VGATSERWSLMWRRSPAPACSTGDIEAALTCPCDGFAYGEKGELDLIRRRAGHSDERLALTPLFGDGEGAPGSDSLAVLQRWPVQESDYGTLSDSTRDIASTVRARPVTRAMNLGDYDHDGSATEFPLQIGTTACGHQEAVVVGISPANPSLHAFTSVAHPERPLVLDPDTWAQLLHSHGSTTVVEWRCLDHGSETQTEVTLRTGPAGIDGTRSEYRCRTGGVRGRLVRSERI